MRKLFGWACVLAWAAICLCAQTASTAKKKSSATAKKTPAAATEKTAPKKSSAKSSGKSAAASGKASSGKTGAASAPAKKSSSTKKGTSKSTKKRTPATTWRNRQTKPSPDRYKEIQDALVARGFLAPDSATGEWGPGSVEALKRFQAAQNLEVTGKVNSLSLIALGLGPKREAAAKPADATTPTPR